MVVFFIVSAGHCATRRPHPANKSNYWSFSRINADSGPFYPSTPMQRFGSFLLLALFSLALTGSLFAQTEGSQDWYRKSGLWRNDTLSVASSHLKKKNYSEALREINSVLSADPGDIDALLMRASAYHDLKRYDLALADINRCLTNKYAHLRKAEALHLRASVHLARNNKRQAVEDLKGAITHKIDYLPPYQLLMQQVSPSEFIAIVSEVSGKSAGKRDQWVPLSFLAFAYERKGEPMVAVARAMSALRVKDDIPEVHELLRKYVEKDPQRYVGELTSIINANLTSKSVYASVPRMSLRQRADVYARTGKFELALGDMDRILKIFQTGIKTEEHASHVRFRAHLLAATNKMDEALATINSVIQSGFLLGEAHGFRAEIYCRTGKKAEAKADERKTISLGGKVLKPCK